MGMRLPKAFLNLKALRESSAELFSRSRFAYVIIVRCFSFLLSAVL